MWGQTDTGFPVTAICRADLTSTMQDVVIRRVERGLLISTMSDTPACPDPAFSTCGCSSV
jgi:hypothetical protein